MKKNFFSLLLLLLLLLPFFVSASTPFSATIQTSTSEVAIDQTFDVTVTLAHPQTHRPSQIALHPSFTVISEQKSENTITYTLEAWKTGKQAITTQSITFAPIDSTKHQPVTILPTLVTVTVLPSAAPPFTLKPELLPLDQYAQIEISKGNENSLAIGAAQAADRNVEILKTHSFPWGWFLFLAAITIAWKKRHLIKRLTSRRLSSEEEKTPQEKALLALQKLIQDNLPQHNLFDPYYVRITGIIRSYIEERYIIDAPERTTEEFLQVASTHTQFTENSRRLLKDFLLEADLVKFAKQQSNPQSCEQAYRAAIQFVKGESL